MYRWIKHIPLALFVCAIVVGLGQIGCARYQYKEDRLQVSPSNVTESRDQIGSRGRVFGIGGMTRWQEGTPAVPGSMPSRSEELWIIAKPSSSQIADASDTPRSGALIVRDGEQTLAFPLAHTDVKARIDGYIATVDVTQQYHNPFSGKIEAVYVFPLPENAAVSEFVMTIGDRVIRGIIREKEEAKKIYDDAKSQGYVASLLEQERPNVFTQRVANIEPGKQVDIGIRYFHTLSYDDGWYEFVFPMVVGPRFNPPLTSDGVGATARGQVGASGQKTQVQYLAPNERTGHDVSLNVDLNAGVAIEEIASSNHAINVDSIDNATRKISIKPTDRLPNKDFVLRFKVAGKTLKSGVIAQRDPRGGGYFALMLYPPESTDSLPRRPIELCFLMDVSGSMTGAPLDQSRNAIQAALGMMQPTDRFNIIRFAGSTDMLYPASVFATEREKRSALQFINDTRAGGGTMMLDGIKQALNQPAEESRGKYVCMMSDGFIGNERQIIQVTRQLRGQTRVFGFGVGSSPNRYLIDGMSRAGAGAVAYLGLHDDGAVVMRHFLDRTSKPALTNLQIDTTNLKGAQINPFKIPDVYVGRAVVITGRFEGQGGSITLRGESGGQMLTQTFPIKPDRQGTSLASVWARQQIAALFDQATLDDIRMDLGHEIKTVALTYGLMSDYTSFIAVDSTHRTSGAVGTTVVQPVPVPDGVKYETTVPERP